MDYIDETEVKRGVPMNELKFTQEHEWVLLDGPETCIVGITEYAQKELGELVYVEFPELGSECERGAEIAVIESVKAASELYAPVTGTILSVNEILVENPRIVNDDPFGDGWFVRVKLEDPKELAFLLSESAYGELVGNAP